MDFMGNGGFMNPPMMNQNVMQMKQTQGQTPQYPQQQMIDPRVFDTPKISGGSVPKFTITDKNADTKTLVHIDEQTTVEEKPKRKYTKKQTSNNSINETNSTSVIPVSSGTPATSGGSVESAPTAYTYMETTGMLRQTLTDIDMLASQLAQEFTVVKQSRTMKNKYNVLVGLSENMGSLINTKISAIREINSSISKSNELDYKKYKDIQAAQSAQNDDKYIADLYQAFLKNPQAQMNVPQLPAVDTSIFGSGIVRANIQSTDLLAGANIPGVDAGYMNYVSNLSPEQNMMRYENNPDIKQVVVYDASNNNKFFQYMNTRTGEVIPNMPVYDQMFMEDTTIDLNNRIAKNINLNETFPLIVINDNITSQY